MAETVHAQKLVDYSELHDGWSLTGVSVGPDHEPVVMMSEPARNSFPSQRMPEPTAHELFYRNSGRWSMMPLPEMEPIPRLIQPLPSAEWLIAGFWPEEELRNKARVFNRDGVEVRTFEIGNLIKRMQVDDQGHIWCGYMDEGVLSSPPADLAHSGLACLSTTGEVFLDFNRTVGKIYPLDMSAKRRSITITDCYALNVVSATETWAYYYTDFPLVRISPDGIERVWRRSPVTRAQAFAVTDGSVIFTGGLQSRYPHRPFKDRLLRQVSLEDPRQPVRYLRSVDSYGVPGKYDLRRSFGRGSTLYLVTSHALYAVNCSDL